MMPHHPPSPQAPRSPRPGVSTASSDGSFWLLALLVIPAINVGLLGLVASAAGVLFLPVAALVALGDLALLILLARTYGIGVSKAPLAMLVNVVITVCLPILLFAAACGSCLG